MDLKLKKLNNIQGLFKNKFLAMLCIFEFLAII